MWHRLRKQADVHPGIVHELTGFAGPASFHGLPSPDRPHFSAFSFAACDAVYRNDEVFASSPNAVDPVNGEVATLNSMLSMGGTQHRRYRSLVQPSFVPAKAEWWIRNWIEETVRVLIDAIVDDGRAELNVDFCAAIPVLTITGSFGVPVEQALDIRAALSRPAEIVGMLAPIVAARRESPKDDLISVLVEAESHRGWRDSSPVGSRDLLVRHAPAGGRFGHDLETDGHQRSTALLQRPEVLRRCVMIAGCSAQRSRKRCGGRRPTPCSRGG